MWGIVDGVIALSDGGYGVIDIKTTSQFRVRSIGLNTYADGLENAADGYPHLTPVKRLGILTFTGYRFGVNHPGEAGIVGSLGWHEVRIDGGLVGKALGQAVMIFQRDDLPPVKADCAWCQFYRTLGL